MVKQYTQESNSTGLSITRESSLGVLPANPVWAPREPNSYKDFGPAYKSKARTPINASRQQQKGVTVDRDASGGWQEDLTYPALSSMIEAVMFAAFRTKGDVVVSSVDPTNGYVVTAGGDYYKTGDILAGVGFTVPANNGAKLLTANGSATDVEVAGLATEANATGYITKVGHQFATGDIALVLNGNVYSVVATAGSIAALGVIRGETVYIDGLGGLGGFCRVGPVSADGKTAILDKMQHTGATSGAGLTASIYVGRVVRNESNPALIKRYTHTLERTLGKDDDTAIGPQAEYIHGAVVDTFAMPFNTADKITMDFSMEGTNYTTVTSAQGLLAGTRPSVVEGDAFTTSNDVQFALMNVVGTAAPLYAYLTDISLNVNNNVKGAKAVGILGSFDLTAGNFVVTMAANAYLADVNAANAIADNDSVTVALGLVRSGQGIVIDLPLVTLGDGKPKVAANEPITVALTVTGASGRLLSADLDYTMMMVFFDYLPPSAGA